MIKDERTNDAKKQARHRAGTKTLLLKLQEDINQIKSLLATSVISIQVPESQAGPDPDPGSRKTNRDAYRT